MIFRPEAFPRESFMSCAHELFSIQSDQVKPFHEWLKNLDFKGGFDLTRIPFLPIQLFKSSDVYDFHEPPEAIFTSSRTTGNTPSRHWIARLQWYESILCATFENFFSDVRDYAFLFLLPGYFQRPDASLVYMAQTLHKKSERKHEAFFNDDFKSLNKTLEKLCQSDIRVVLLGVTYALLDFSKKTSADYDNLIIIETGGMKRMGPEISKPELFEKLNQAFPQAELFSEYGMTELHSQAYCKSGEPFTCPPWMRVLVRDPDDPFAPAHQEGKGVLQIIDLANIHSCAFISTEDLGTVYSDGRFEVHGRLDDAEIRGCQLLYERKN